MSRMSAGSFLMGDVTISQDPMTARLYESPYTDLNAQGLDGLFSGEAADALNEIKRRAAA